MSGGHVAACCNLCKHVAPLGLVHVPVIPRRSSSYSKGQGRQSRPVADRLWPFVAGPWRVGVAESDCWLWTGYSQGDYGRLGMSRREPARSALPHRLALLLMDQVTWPLAPPDRSGMDACHTCDTPLCCNPAHLFWGSRAENMADMIRKGRAFWQRRAGVNWGRAAAAAAELEESLAELERVTA